MPGPIFNRNIYSIGCSLKYYILLNIYQLSRSNKWKEAAINCTLYSVHSLIYPREICGKRTRNTSQNRRTMFGIIVESLHRFCVCVCVLSFFHQISKAIPHQQQQQQIITTSRRRMARKKACARSRTTDSCISSHLSLAFSVQQSNTNHTLRSFTVQPTHNHSKNNSRKT